MKIDMHIHSTFSDGNLSIERIVDTAKEKKIWYLSLTDHDTVEGIDLFLKYSKAKGIDAVSGVEISTAYKKTHILGYNFKDLKTMDIELKKIAKMNHNICLQIIEDMRKDNIILSAEDVLKISKSSYMTLKDIAKSLVKHKIVVNENEAFIKYLSFNGKYFYELEKMHSTYAIQLIKDCGGIPVLAHPYYSYYSNVEEEINTFIDKGLMGIEVYYSLHKDDQKEFLRNMAIKNNLIMTAGTDFHKFNGKKCRNIGIEIDYTLFYEMMLSKVCN